MRQCRTCGEPEEPHNFRHPFVADDDSSSPDGLGPSKNQPKDSAPEGHGSHALPIDPVLRIALIDAGVITVDQLDAAQRKVQHTQQGMVIRTASDMGMFIETEGK